MTDRAEHAGAPAPEGFTGILAIFLRLGLTSFGGPVAHLGYLRTEFVTRRRWMTRPGASISLPAARGPASCMG